MMNAIEIRQIAIVVTYGCNLKCKYCFVSNKNDGSTIKVRTVLQAVAMWQRYFSHGYKRLGILFTGGEPLIEWDLILCIINELESCYPDISFEYHITTNGVLMTERILPELLKRQIYICASLDGDEMNSSERLNCSHSLFSTIQHNVITYLGALGERRFRVRMTITPQNALGFLDSVDFFVRLGVKNIHFSPNYEEKWDYESVNSYFYAYSELKRYDNSGLILEPYHSFSVNGVEKFGPYEHDCSFLPTIDTKGNVYYCPRYAGKKLKVLGNVENPIEVLLKFREIVDWEKELFSQKQLSFLCPSNYLEAEETLTNFRLFYDMYERTVNSFASISKRG